MKKLFLLSIIMCYSLGVFSQNLDPKIDQTTFQNEDVTTNDLVKIPLYNIDIEGLKLPIYLTYDNSGIKVNELPSTVGLKWQLNAGGMIKREVNHIPDEFQGKTSIVSEESQGTTIYGWFYDDWTIFNFEGEYYGNPAFGHQLSAYHDASPDLYHFQASNGDYSVFSFEKIFDDPTSQQSDFELSKFDISKNQNYKIGGRIPNVVGVRTDCDDCSIADYKLTSDSGVEYLFEKGIEKEIPYVDGFLANIQAYPSQVGFYTLYDFYLKKMRSRNNDNEINFEYINNTKHHYDLIGHIEEKSYTSGQTKLSNYWEGVLISDSRSKEVSEITTPKEKLVFNYNDYQYDISSGQIFGSDPFERTISIKLLDEILIYDFEDNFVSGYKFEYEIYQAANQKPFLKKIIRLGKDQSSEMVFREFEYYGPDEAISSDLSPRRDALGYSNLAFGNDDFDSNDYRNITPVRYRYSIDSYVDGADRTPNLSSLESGMLKSIKTRLGGRIEYKYQMNSHGNDYYGGVLVNQIIKYDSNDVPVSKKAYSYENPNGFGLPIFSSTDSWKDYFKELIEVSPGLDRYRILNFSTRLLDTDYQDQTIVGAAQRYQKYGNFYKKVITTDLDLDEEETENLIGSTIHYFRPEYNTLGRRKLIDRVEAVNNTNDLIESKVYNYDVTINDEISTIKFNNIHDNSYSGGCPNGENDSNYVEDPLLGGICVAGEGYRLEAFKIMAINSTPREIVTTKYNNSETISWEEKTRYEYLNEDGNDDVDFTKIKKIFKYNANTSIVGNYTEFLYLNELNPQNNDFSNLLEYSNPLIQRSTWTPEDDDILKNSTVFKYYNDGKIKSISKETGATINGDLKHKGTYVYPYFNAQNEIITSAILKEKYFYNDEGFIRQKSFAEKPYREFYYRSNDYDKNYTTAVLREPVEYEDWYQEDLSQKFAHFSFEYENVDTSTNINAFSGNRVYTGSVFDAGNFINDIVVSYWYFKNGKWSKEVYVESSGNIIINVPADVDFIDELRIYPNNSKIETFTYLPIIGVNSSMNNQDFTRKKHYDLYNRLIYITDRDNNVIEEIKQNSINE